jgi:hypothetical protein
MELLHDEDRDGGSELPHDLPAAPTAIQPATAPSAGETSQSERAVMRPDSEDPEWRYFFGAWHS